MATAGFHEATFFEKVTVITMRKFRFLLDQDIDMRLGELPAAADENERAFILDRLANLSAIRNGVANDHDDTPVELGGSNDVFIYSEGREPK